MMTPCKPPHQSMRPFDVNMLVFHVCRQKWLTWWRSIYSQREDMQDMPQQEEEVWGEVGSGALVVWWRACVRYLNCHPVTFNLAGHESQILPGFKLPNRTCLKCLSSLQVARSRSFAKILWTVLFARRWPRWTIWIWEPDTVRLQAPQQDMLKMLSSLLVARSRSFAKIL